jgi:hypothetical protein
MSQIHHQGSGDRSREVRTPGVDWPRSRCVACQPIRGGRPQNSIIVTEMAVSPLGVTLISVVLSLHFCAMPRLLPLVLSAPASNAGAGDHDDPGPPESREDPWTGTTGREPTEPSMPVAWAGALTTTRVGPMLVTRQNVHANTGPVPLAASRADRLTARPGRAVNRAPASVDEGLDCAWMPRRLDVFGTMRWAPCERARNTSSRGSAIPSNLARAGGPAGEPRADPPPANGHRTS